jgi:hypothetical protein
MLDKLIIYIGCIDFVYANDHTLKEVKITPLCIRFGTLNPHKFRLGHLTPPPPPRCMKYRLITPSGRWWLFWLLVWSTWTNGFSHGAATNPAWHMEQIKSRSRTWSDLVLNVYSLVSDTSVQANAEILQETLPTGVFFAIDGYFEICTGFRFNYSLVLNLPP